MINKKKVCSSVLVLLLLLVCGVCFTLTSCSDKDDVPDLPKGYETTITLDSENYSEYLKVEGVVNNSGASLFPYSSLPGVKKSYIKPKMIVKVTPIDDTHVFSDTTITVSVNYVFRLWNTSPGSTNDFVGWEDIVTKEVAISIDSTGSGSVVIESSSASNKLYVCGFTSVYPTNVTGKVSVPCLHEWQDGETITPASCTSAGTISVKCTKCNKTKEKSIDALGHDLPTTPTSSTPATCTTAGSETYSCERCGESETKTIDALGHTYNESEAVTTPATCTNAGKVDYTCTRCGSVNSDVIDALGHSFTNYTTTDATCTSDSYKTAKCDRCDEIDTITNEDTALGHNYGADGKCTRCFTINPNLKVTSLEISNDSFLLEAGKATQVEFAVYPSDAIYEKVTYRIYQNNTCEATISENGLLTCGKVGSVTIAVTIDDEITARATFYVPQMITTAEEFFNIRNDLGGIYMLANDIDLSGYANWTPIGNATKNASGNYDYTNAFSGKFDGGGYTISGLNINLSNSSCSSLLTVGLFGSLSRDGQISNVVLKDANVTGTSNATEYVGMLVGFNPGSVNDCSVNGTMAVSGATYIGGVIGENIGSAEKISSNVAITVTGSKNYLVGGITGRTAGGQLSDVNVSGSINVTSSAPVYVGGVAGNLVDKLTTASADVDIIVKTTASSSSYNYVGVIAGASSQSLSDIIVDGSITVESYGNAYVGGIVGYSDASISKCENNAIISLIVTNNGNASYVGGIVGFTSKNIDNCENNSTVSATQFYGGYVGGVAGNSGAVSNCKNNADVYAKSTSKTVYCGGVVGYAKSIDSCTNNAKVDALVYASNANYAGGVVGYSEGAISNCTNNENGELLINYSSSTSSSSSNQYFGGVAGYGKSTVSDSTNYANVSAYSNGVVYCGGVVGYANGNVTKVNNYAYSLTINSGSTNSSYSNYAGGVAGYINGTLTTAYNTANVSVTKGNVAVGGVAGYVNGSATSVNSTANIIVNNTVSGQNVLTYVGGVIGNTPSSLTSSSATNSNIEVNSKNKVYVGGIAGNCGGTITECYAYPNITVNNSYVTYVGGVSGYANKIAKSYSTSNIISNTLGSYDLYVGGLSGYVSTRVEESYATGDIAGTASSKVYMAGLVGYVGNGATITNCYVSNGYIKTNSSSFSSSSSILVYNGGLVGYNGGTISNSYAVNYGYSVSHGSSNNHTHYIGGLVAYNNGTISSSYVLDAIDKLARTDLEINRDVVGSGTAQNFYAGGFVGYNQGTVSNCYSDATVNTTVSGAYTGGFVGFNSATIKNSIAYGEVNSGITGDTTGGFAGGGTSGYTSCYFSKDSTLQTTSVGSATQSGISASTNADLRKAATFSGFNSTYWNIVDGTYPALIFGNVWENKSDGFNKYNMLVNVPNKDNQYQFPHGDRVTISFESNGGETTDSIVVNKGNTIVLPTLADYELNGVKYVFSGWCTDSECLNLVEEKIIKVTDSQKYYAYYRQAIARPEATEYTYTGNKISVADVYKNNECYTVTGTFDGTVVGEYKVVLKLTHWYCWDDSTISDYEIVWTITPCIVDIPNIYNSGSYVFYTDENRDLSSEFGSELYTTTGDIVVNKLDLNKYSVKFNLKDTKNYIWSDSTITEKTFDYYVATGACNASNSTVAYWLKDDTLTIIGEGNMANYSSGRSPWYNRRSEIKNIVISSDVKSIGNYAFYGLDEVASIVIPNNIETIGNNAFANCTSLTNISIPSSVANLGSGIFSGCSSLETISLPFIGQKLRSNSYPYYEYTFGYIFGTSSYTGGVATSQNYRRLTASNSWQNNTSTYYIPESLKNVTILGGDVCEGAFYNCTTLQKVIFGDGVKSSIAKNAFYNCSNLKEIICGDGISSIGQTAFSGCTSLTNVELSSSVTSIGSSAFYNCSSLKEIVVPNSVTSISGGAFSGCSALERITLPFIGGSSKTKTDTYQDPLGYIFGTNSYTGGVKVRQYYYGYSTSSTTDNYYYIPETLKSVSVTGGEILYGAFYGCSSLETITIGENIVEIGRSAFYNCSNLTSVNLSDKITKIGSGAFYNCTALNQIIIPNSLTSIESVAFYGCSSIKSITIPSSVQSISSDAFRSCYGLTEIVVHADNANYLSKGNCLISSDGTLILGCNNSIIPTDGSIKKINYYAFYNCSELTSITIPNGVTSIGYNAFSGCSKLQSVTIGDDLQSIGSNAFSDCSSLKSIVIPASVTSIENGVFSGCSSLETITLPFVGSSAAATSASYSTLFGYIFGTSQYEGGVATTQYYGASSSRTHYLPQTLTKVTITGGNILYGSFYNCNKIVTIDLSGVQSIGEKAFANCTSLATVNFGNEILNIDSNAFEGCIGLKDLTIPDSVISIGSGAFSGCSSLETITLPFVGANSTATTASASTLFGYIFGTKEYDGGIASTQYYNSSESVKYYIPSSLTKVVMKGKGLLYGAFYGVSGVKQIFFSDNIEFAEENVFQGCDNLTYNEYGNGLYLGSESNPYLFLVSLSQHDITSVDIHPTTKIIYYNVFYNCTTLKSITISESITNIGSSTFQGCSGLEEIIVAEGNAIYKSIGNCLIDIKTGTLILGCKNSVIPNDGSVKSIGSYAFYECEGLVSIAIPDGVISIGDYAFYKCDDLKNVTFGSGLTTIGSNAFYGCSGITALTVPSSVTNIGNGAFNGCSSLESIELPFVGANGAATTASDSTLFGYIFGTEEYEGGVATSQYYSGGSRVTYYIPSVLSSVKIAGGDLLYGAFYNCQNLVAIDLGEVDSIGSNVFYGCKQLKKMTMPNTIQVVNEGLFYGCSALEEVVLGNSVTSIESKAFYNCSSLKTVSLPNTLQNIQDYAFYGCSSIENLDIPNLNHLGNNVFDGCSSLVYTEYNNGYYLGNTDNQYLILIKAKETSISNVTIANTTKFIYDNAFIDCVNLPEIALPNTIVQLGNNAFKNSGITSIILPESVINIGEAVFAECANLTTVTIEGNIEVIADSMFYNCTSLTGFTIPESVRRIGASAFYGCVKLYRITIPENTTSIGSSVFYNCTNLSSISIKANLGAIPDYFLYGCSVSSISIPSTVTSIGDYAFYGLPITSITIPSNVTNLGSYAFAGCSKLSRITINGSITSLKDGVFRGCKSLTSISIPDSVSSIGANAFTGCSALSSINIPSSVRSVGDSAFYGCSSITSITLPSGVRSIGRSTFYDCTSLRTITINGSITSIGEFAFSGCTSLSGITLPASLTSIGRYAFRGCTSITSVTIPGAVRFIGEYAFNGCSRLTRAYFENTSGWKAYSTWWEGGTASDFNSSSLTNASTAATWLTTTYSSQWDWKR